METFIIHDIDVSECEYRKQGFCNCSGHEVTDENGELNRNALTFGMHCRDNPNCYYKQLQQARIRIKDLEERIIKQAEEIDEYCSRLATSNNEKTSYKNYLQELKLITKLALESEDLETSRYYSKFARRKICEVLNANIAP